MAMLLSPREVESVPTARALSLVAAAPVPEAMESGAIATEAVPYA